MLTSVTTRKHQKKQKLPLECKKNVINLCINSTAMAHFLASRHAILLIINTMALLALDDNKYTYCVHIEIFEISCFWSQVTGPVKVLKTKPSHFKTHHTNIKQCR